MDLAVSVATTAAITPSDFGQPTTGVAMGDTCTRAGIEPM